MRNEHIMAAPIDMLCHSYKSVWIDLIEAKKKGFFGVVIFKSCFVTCDRNHLIPWLLLSSQCVLVSSKGL